MISPYQRKVYYYETDKMGIVHHSNYIRWLEEARIYYLNVLGIDFHKIEEDGLYCPVLSASCTYKKAVRFPEEFSIVARMTMFNGVRYRLAYEIYVQHSKTPVAVGETEHCFANHKMQPVRIRHKFPEVFQRMMEVLPRETADL